MDLPCVTPETVAPSVTCRKVIKIMKQLAVDQVPIVHLDGNVVGVATLGNIMAKIIAGVINDTTPVSEVIYRQFMKVSPNVTLGKLSKILEHHWFAIVVNSQKVLVRVKKWLFHWWPELIYWILLPIMSRENNAWTKQRRNGNIYGWAI